MDVIVPAPSAGISYHTQPVKNLRGNTNQMEKYALL